MATRGTSKSCFQFFPLWPCHRVSVSPCRAVLITFPLLPCVRDCHVALACLVTPRNDNLPPCLRACQLKPWRRLVPVSDDFPLPHPLPITHYPLPFTLYPHTVLPARAKVSTQTSAPALRRIPVQALTVAPVVYTSSKSTTVRPFTRVTVLPGAKDPLAFSILPLADKPTWVVLSTLLRTSA